VTYLIGKDGVWVLVEEYGTKTLIPFLVVVFSLLSLDDANLLPQDLVLMIHCLMLLLPQKKQVKDC